MSIGEILKNQKSLWIDTLLSAMYIVYLGQIDENDRKKYSKLVMHQYDHGTSEEFSITNFLSKASMYIKWISWEMKGGDAGLENCLLVDSAQNAVS